MQQPVRPTVWLPIVSLAWLAYAPIWAYLHPHAEGRTIEASIFLWFPVALILWFFVLCYAMINYRCYSNVASAQSRLRVWVVASVAPLLLLAVGSILNH